MTRELTPWEKLDGIKHSLNFIGNSLDSIIEGAVEWERSRIIKLLEEMPWQIYSGVGIDGKPIESVWTPKVLIREDVIALIKGEK